MFKHGQAYGFKPNWLLSASPNDSLKKEGKNPLYWHKGRHTDQWNPKEPRKNPHRYGQLTYNKRAKNIQWGKKSLQKNGAGKTGQPYAKELKQATILHHTPQSTQTGLQTST